MSFCTNCGNEVHEHAVACPKCGVPPRLEKNYCGNCGVKLENPNQVICVKCGVPIIQKPSDSGTTAPSRTGSRKHTVAGIFALFLGSWGAHKFYNGSWGWGIIYIVVTLTLIGAIFTGITAFIEALILLTMDDGKYDEKYNVRPPEPFKW